MMSNPTRLALAIGTSALLAACASNTKMDDGSYRTIGQSAPRQVQNHAASQINEQAGNRSEWVGQRDYQVVPDDVPVPDFPGATAQAQVKGGQRSIGNSQIVRYGHPRIIDKIVQTARIHCQPLQYRITTNKNSFWGDGSGVLTQCTYRFPAFCGAHTYSLLTYGDKEVLVYKPKDGTHYVIDTLKGTPRSQPGLWDQDDHIGTSTTNAGYFFEGDYNHPYRQDQFNPANLGWIIKASHQDEEKYGQLYHKAITEITQCF